MSNNAITWTDVTALDASLASVPTAAQTHIIDDAYATLDESRWGTKYHLAAKYLSAHVGSLLLRGGGNGASTPVILESLGDASRGYATPFASTSSWNDLELTIWGKLYKRLARQVVPFAFVV